VPYAGTGEGDTKGVGQGSGAGQAGSFQGFRVTAAAPVSLVMLDSLVALDSVVCVAW
jgi:hypothetical protein